MTEAGRESLCLVERPGNSHSKLTRNSLRQKVTAIPSGARSCWKSSSPMLVSVTMALLLLSMWQAGTEGVNVSESWLHSWLLFPRGTGLMPSPASSSW